MADSPWIDVSVPLHNAMVHWPGDPTVAINPFKEIERGDSSNLSAISMGAHSGTHVDAPRHFISRGTGVDKMPVEAMVGRARVIEIKDAESIRSDELQQHRIRRGERILFKTRNSSYVWQSDKFVEDFVYLSDEAAEFLVSRRIRLVGVDYLSVGGYKGGGFVHRKLLGNGIWIIEGLDLSRALPGKYQLICLPLKLVDGDGAPARAFIRPLVPGR